MWSCLHQTCLLWLGLSVSSCVISCISVGCLSSIRNNLRWSYLTTILLRFGRSCRNLAKFGFSIQFQSVGMSLNYWVCTCQTTVVACLHAGTVIKLHTGCSYRWISFFLSFLWHFASLDIIMPMFKWKYFSKNAVNWTFVILLGVKSIILSSKMNWGPLLFFWVRLGQ